MTDQERPVEERNELLDDLLTAATPVAADEQDQSQQPAVDEQPEPAEQPVAVPDAEATQADDAPAATEQSADLPVAEAHAATEVTPLESAAIALDESTEVPVAEADTASKPSTDEPAAEAAVVPESNTDAPAVEAVAIAANSTNVALVDPYTQAAATAAPEGASYAPVPDQESGKPRRIKDIEPGMELEGRVTSIALYGIFVDIGVGRDGLVHISEMSDTRIDSPSDIVQIGDTVKVR
ncbi:MAG: S1 RNA-binding domain-containing protein, partial [Roseiflexaceae bacterium]